MFDHFGHGFHKRFETKHQEVKFLSDEGFWDKISLSSLCQFRDP